MDLKISKVQKVGKENSEFVRLSVENDCELGEYLIADSTYTNPGQISNKLRHVYWFPDQKVKKGDTVFLVTGKGTNSIKENGSNTIYQFHWNLNEGVWNDDGDVAVLFHEKEWEFTKSEK
ncbi:MAG: hypothetical protein HF314_17535 [Ignavibacteria bacterium]|jgi:hypothetical protein|nr:hypothetical protein [Ignavibacteria bacterium]MCU7504889.1 hypothetical protein [Ignavibacteria bacterium]MCU7517846.1 hypothetical protein [Ignavibacteria bacterium]